MSFILVSFASLVCFALGAVALALGWLWRQARVLRTLKAFDTPWSITDVAPSAAHGALEEEVRATQDAARALRPAARIAQWRTEMDARGTRWPSDARIEPVTLGGLTAEWVVAPEASPERRLLYIHGGAYMTGSAVSHRPITTRLSKAAGAAVLAINQRLMPEHHRFDGLQDCRDAYRWMASHGPDGHRGAPDVFLVAGDSSGGNLALSTVAWARDTRERPADAVIVLSPQTDLTLSSPSLAENAASDAMQGASFGPIARAPWFMRLCASAAMHRVSPFNPVVSPLLGRLHDLPPTLVQASAHEMFRDDAVRYVHKARAHGSAATLQLWPRCMHVWHAFDIPEAQAAYDAIRAFLAGVLR